MLDTARATLTPKNDDDGEPFQLMREIGNQLDEKRSTNPLIGSAKRHAKDHIPDLLSLLLGAFTNSYAGLDNYSHFGGDHELQTSEKLLSGTIRVPVRDAEIRPDNAQFPISVEGLDEQLRLISDQFDIGVKTFLESLSDEEINIAARKPLL
jgi:hypothetical protein